MPSTDTLRVALLGYGHGGSVFHAPLIARTPGMRVAAIVTNAVQRREQAQRDFPTAVILSSAEDVWRNASEYDLVVVATPNRTHADLALAAMSAGLPVVVDKPAVTNVADMERLIVASHATGQMLTVFHNARWSNAFLTVQRVLQSNLLGAIVRFEARMERYRPQPRSGAWRERGEAEEGGGLLFDLGSHLIDQALVLFGHPLRVYAELEHRRPGTAVDDDTFVAIEFESGVRAHLWMSYVVRSPGPTMRVVGLQGTYEKQFGDPQEEALRARRQCREADWGTESAERWGRLSADVGGLHLDGQVESIPGNYPSYYAQVRDALFSGSPLPVDPHDVVQTLRVIEAAQESAREHRVVSL